MPFYHIYFSFLCRTFIDSLLLPLLSSTPSGSLFLSIYKSHLVYSCLYLFTLLFIAEVSHFYSILFIRGFHVKGHWIYGCAKRKLAETLFRNYFFVSSFSRERLPTRKNSRIEIKSLTRDWLLTVKDFLTFSSESVGTFHSPKALSVLSSLFQKFRGRCLK